MSFSNRKAFILLGFILILSSCVYNENDTYYFPIDSWEQPTPVLTTNLDTIDTPEVIDSLEVIYNITVDTGQIIFTRFLLSDSLIFDSDSAESRFWLKNTMVTGTGNRTLKMEAYYSTTSGSMADILGLEVYRETWSYEIWFY